MDYLQNMEATTTPQLAENRPATALHFAVQKAVKKAVRTSPSRHELHAH